MELRGYVQTYLSGQLSRNSIVANLHWNPKNKKRRIDETSEKHYAELWIGSNPDGEAILRNTKQKLSEFIAKHPHVLGISSYLYEDKLPFLLKVLSIASPTPIMIHPNERLASKLHEKDPSSYPDSVHQPLLLVTLSDFELIVGFRPKNEIIFFLKEVPELSELIKPKLLEDFIRTKKSYYLKLIIECYMNNEEDKVTEAIKKYFARMEKEDFQTCIDLLFELTEKIHKLFPYDSGIFLIYFLNHLKLTKDEAIYIRPLVPYSFLFGDAVVCTTNCNNCIPVAFTSGKKEVSSFIEYADYESFEIDQLKVKPSFEPFLTIYDCDEDEFLLSKVTIYKNDCYSIYGKRSLCVFIVIKGTGMTLEQTKIKVGTIMLIPPCNTFHMRAIEDMTLFMAEPNLVI